MPRSVYERLRSAIINMEFEPGRRLSENELALLFRVSRTPIREALVRLRDDRLVDVAPQYGTFVALITDSAVADAQFVRVALECAAIRLAAERIDDHDLVAIRSIVKRQTEATRERSHDHFYDLDDDFHRAVFELSGHQLFGVVQRADSHLNRIRRLSLPEPRYMREMVAEHKLVLDALSRHDPEGAEAALKHHLAMAVSTLDDLRAAHPEYFETDDRFA